MTSATKKAYDNGYRMGQFICKRDGIKKATDRNSITNVRYSREALRAAYDKGYWDGVNAA